MDSRELERFREAQEGTFARACAEVAAGRKAGHWMWFIFPQIAGLGSSPTAELYAIRDMDEAFAYIDDPVLGERLREICQLLLEQPKRDAELVFGHIDALKLRSSMTLFHIAEPDGVFGKVLDEFFGGERDPLTLEILERQEGRDVR